MLISGRVRTEFDVKNIVSPEMDHFVERCMKIYRGTPEWLEEGVKTVNFAESICTEVARLAVQGTSIKADGEGPRAEWLNDQINAVYYTIRKWVEYACVCGTLILKPDGENVLALMPDKFMITSVSKGKVDGCVFIAQERSSDGDTWYTKLEYHHFEEDRYIITNRCFKGEGENDLSTRIPIEASPWRGLEEETSLDNIEKPLFAVLRMPSANRIDVNSPLAMPIFSSALEELHDLDVAYSRNANEIYDSERIVLLDTDKLLPKKNIQTNVGLQEATRDQMKLPKYVRNVAGDGASGFYQEINPTLNTQMRIAGIDNLLSQIGYKCGFSNGYFVLDQKSGMVTATQVESDDRRTLQLIKDVRDQLESAIHDLVYALNKFADLYDYAPSGDVDVICDFGDLTYNVEEDRARWIQYVNMGLVPGWKLLEKFEGMTEEEAKAMAQQTQGEAMEQKKQEYSLFGDAE